MPKTTIKKGKRKKKTGSIGKNFPAVLSKALVKNWYTAVSEFVYNAYDDNAEEVFKDYAKELELDVEKFGNDFLSKEVRDVVREDLTLALNLGLDSTPTIFINGKKYVGPATVADLNSALEKSR